MAQERMAEETSGPGTEGPPQAGGSPDIQRSIAGPDAPSWGGADANPPAWGGQNPLETLRGQLTTPETELNPEGKKPEEVVSIMQRIDTEEAATRETHKEVFQQACDVLKTYAHKSKLLDLDTKTINLERELDRADQAVIDQVDTQNPRQGMVLQGLLDSLDSTEEELTRVVNTLGDDQYEGLFSKEGWEQFKKTREKLQQEKTNFEQQITGMTPQNFLAERNQKKNAIRQAKEKAVEDDRVDREKAIKEQRAEPEKWELELEQLLLQDAEPTITQPGKTTFAEQLEFFREQQKLKDTGDPNFQQQDLDQAREGLSWYLHQARRVGVFDDLEERLDHKYQEWASSLLPHREMSQLDMLTDSPGRLTQKTFAEIEDEIIEYFSALLDNNKSQYVEHSARWDLLQRRGLTSAARQALQGIRGEFIKRAQAQIEDSLLNFDLPDRISGEWNVHRIERVITERRERQALEAGIEPWFREESYYRIKLLGNTRQEIELGADQAAENITQSATTFDISAIQQRMEMLLKALREKSTDLQRSERISKKDADDLIVQMEDSVTNKIDFFILNWAGENLQMDLFNSFLEQRMRIRGVEKLRQMPSMNDGLVGIALSLLLSDQYRLYYRPQGFKGQLFDDDTTHKYLRDLLEEQLISKLMEYELKGGIDEKTGREDEERTRARANLTTVTTADQFLSNFERREAPDIRLKRISEDYKQDSKEVEGKKENNQATFEDLARLRVARKVLASEQSRFQEVKRRATSAFGIAAQVMNIFGEAAELGSPSIKMDNGDYIRVDDAVLFYKYVILQAAKEYGEQYGAEDNLAFIRWRSRMWIDRWKNAGLNRANTDNKFHITLTNGRTIPIELQRGFEETGLSKEEWSAFQDAVKKIRESGYNATIKIKVRQQDGTYQEEEKRFEEIIKMDSLRPVNNNFLADYKSSESQINNEVVLEQVAKGKLPAIRNVLRRLGLTGRQGIEGNTTQQRIDNLTQMIEDSRSLYAELERLAYFEATHGLPTEEILDPRMLPFSADRIDYGFQNQSWGVKRLHYLKAFWYTNLRRTVPRGVDLIHAMPFSMGSLSQEMTFENILELALNVNTKTNGMESVDNPALTMFADRHKDLVYLRTSSEGGVDLEKGRIWGFLEKLLVDANALWAVIEGVMPGVTPEQAVLMLTRGLKELTENNKEKIVNALWNEGRGHLGRFAPIVQGTEKLYGEDRQALSSGAGFDENEKFALRFLEWLLSEKRATEEHAEREEAGMEAYSEVADIIRFITSPGSYRAVYKTADGRSVHKVVDKEVYRVEGDHQEFTKDKLVLDLEKSFSIWDEVWRKLTPSHNIRLPVRAPEPTYAG
ncbi:MAG: hypothetical protein AAB414_00715 [Patescibacteria group bacterium]